MQAKPLASYADERHNLQPRTHRTRWWLAGGYHGAPLGDRARAAGGHICVRAGDAAAWRPLHVRRTD